MPDDFSRASLRAAIAAFLLDIPYLGDSVYPHAAKITPMGDIVSPDPMSGASIGAACWIKLESSHNRRAALGKKLKTYRVVLDCLLLAYTPEAEDAEAANDVMLDAVEQRIISDRTAGTGADGTGTDAVWQWGEGEGPMGGTDIDIACGYPTLMDGQRVQVLSRVTVAAQQFTTA